MKPIHLIHHPDCRLHDTGGYHPERPERTQVIVEAFKAATFARPIVWELATPSELSWIEKVHDGHYIRRIEELCLRGETALDRGDTQVSDESFDVARLAAGAAMQTVDCVLRASAHAAFSVMRPPGHHAEVAEAMGFCLFNNIAIAARYAQQAYDLKRVAIIDIDVHHGNGTQAIFYEDPSVLFVSFHQFPFYPGTGSSIERGRGLGDGATLNIPLTAGAKFDEYESAWHDQVLPKLLSFEPEMILISAGFDAHKDDPLANMLLKTSDFLQLTRLIGGFAEQSCGGRVVSILEGGYNLKALAASCVAHVDGLCGIE
ncbi:MAG: histone deacetylase [Verrucomicrobiota bacterium]